MKIHTNNMLVLYTVTTVANALPVSRNVFSRRVFTSIGVSGAHRAFATKKSSDKDDEKKEKDITSKTSKTKEISSLSTNIIGR